MSSLSISSTFSNSVRAAKHFPQISNTLIPDWLPWGHLSWYPNGLAPPLGQLHRRHNRPPLPLHFSLLLGTLCFLDVILYGFFSYLPLGTEWRAMAMNPLTSSCMTENLQFYPQTWFTVWLRMQFQLELISSGLWSISLLSSNCQCCYWDAWHTYNSWS